MRALVLRSALLAGVGLLSMGTARAAITFDLTCILNPPSGNPCQTGPSYGTVTLTDTGSNQVTLTVDLLNSGIKFRDLMLNFTGSGFSDITSSKGENLTISPNGFSISPYGGAFDVGVSGGQGWNTSAATPYTTILSGVGGTLTASLFNALDSGGKVGVALHLQSIGPDGCTGDGATACVPGTTGTGSLKIGGILVATPEPSTLGLAGIALVGLALARKKRLQ